MRWLLITTIATAGCVAQNDPRLKSAGTVPLLEAQVKALQEKVDALQLDVLVLQSASEPYKTASFDPGNPGGYGRIDTTSGTFLVSLQNATPYVDGFRVTCNFGNPSAATFNGFKVKAKWGPRFDPKAKGANWSAWQASLRQKELSLTDNLRPGSWNRVSFVVAPAKAEEFGYLELSMDTDNVSLR